MKLFYKEYGNSGPNLIILHGLLGSLDNWHSIATDLAKSFHVFTIDQRNHGHSPHSQEFNFEALVSDLLEFMEDHSLASASLVGHSMGGKTTMLFALQHPDKVEKLVVVDIAPKAYEKSGHDDVFRALFAVDMSAVKSRKDAEEQIDRQLDDYAVKQFLLKNLSRNANGSYSWKMDLDSIFRNYPEIIKEISGEIPFSKPVLFIRGGRSGYIRDEDLDHIKRLFPLAKLVTIESAGHWVHAEAPKEFMEQLTSFLDS